MKKITIVRHEFINDVCETINHSGLPAFVVVECLERILTECRKAMDEELRRDLEEQQREGEYS